MPVWHALCGTEINPPPSPTYSEQAAAVYCGRNWNCLSNKRMLQPVPSQQCCALVICQKLAVCCNTHNVACKFLRTDIILQEQCSNTATNSWYIKRFARWNPTLDFKTKFPLRSRLNVCVKWALSDATISSKLREWNSQHLASSQQKFQIFFC
jgi:hypothetical protein